MCGLLEEWNLIEVDFQEVYGIDLSDPLIRANRSWRWFLVRLVGLLQTESRMQRVFRPHKQSDKE